MTLSHFHLPDLIDDFSLSALHSRIPTNYRCQLFLSYCSCSHSHFSSLLFCFQFSLSFSRNTSWDLLDGFSKVSNHCVGGPFRRRRRLTNQIPRGWISSLVVALSFLKLSCIADPITQSPVAMGFFFRTRTARLRSRERSLQYAVSDSQLPMRIDCTSRFVQVVTNGACARARA